MRVNCDRCDVLSAQTADLSCICDLKKEYLQGINRYTMGGNVNKIPKGGRYISHEIFDCSIRPRLSFSLYSALCVLHVISHNVNQTYKTMLIIPFFALSTFILLISCKVLQSLLLSPSLISK